MRHLHAFVSLLTIAAAIHAGCQSDNDTTSEEDDTTSGPGTGASGPGTGGTSTVASGGSGGTGGTGGEGGSGGNPNIIGDCSGVGADHLLVNEVVVGGTGAEFVEIYNPGTEGVDLTGYYLSDNSTYFRIAQGMDFNPTTSTPGTDYLVAFPVGTIIGAGEYLVMQTGTDFFGSHAACPDFALSTGVMCNGSPVPGMTVPFNGDAGSSLGNMISNEGEMVILFCWDGTSNTVEDVDYVTWDDDPTDQTHVLKTGETGYAADTPIVDQIADRVVAPAQAGAIFGLERCLDEDEETTTGGNGIAGHDETSEDWAATWQETGATKTPGAANSCL